MTRAKASDQSAIELLEAHAKALEAQVEGLRAEVERLTRERDRGNREWDRLRTAITDGLRAFNSKDTVTAVTILHRALTGAAPETMAVPFHPHIHLWREIGDRCGPMVTHECDCGAAMYIPP